MATASASSGGFRRWRRARPFWGGLLLLIAGLELFLSANLTLGDLQLHFGPEGFLSYLLPLLLVLCGVLTWVTPGQRLFYGILGLLTAVYSLIGLNLGGFFIGMLLGIVGGALVLAWAPQRPRPEATTDTAPENPEGPHGEDEPQPEQPQDEQYDAQDPAATMILPGFGGEPDQHRPSVPQPRSEQYPAGEDDPRPPGGGIHRKALAITLVPLVVTAAVLIAGSHTPARAEVECPEGLPSRPIAAAKKEAARQSSPKPAVTKTVEKTKPVKTVPSAPAPATAAPEPTKTEEPSDNPIVEGWNGLVDGVGDLLGVNEEEEPTPSPSASPSPTTDPEPTGSATVDPSTPASGTPTESGSPAPSDSSASPTPSVTPSLPDIPCLGPRVFKEAGPDDIPTVSLNGGKLETDSLRMEGAAYDGVAELPTATGTIKALKFSMKKATNKPFKLTVAEKTGAQTVIDSKELITEGNVRFYTPEFKGKLFGVIPVTFTPDSPPPLMLPEIWFTDVTIKLAYVRCDTLTGVPLTLSEPS